MYWERGVPEVRTRMDLESRDGFRWIIDDALTYHITSYLKIESSVH